MRVEKFKSRVFKKNGVWCCDTHIFGGWSIMRCGHTPVEAFQNAYAAAQFIKTSRSVMRVNYFHLVMSVLTTIYFAVLIYVLSVFVP